MLTREFINGQWIEVDDQFREYANPAQSSADYWSFLNENPRYSDLLATQDLPSAIEAIGESGYATDPEYTTKLSGIIGSTDEARGFLSDREAELIRAGAPPHIAKLGARQSALETGWGKHAPGGNYYGIKGTKTMPNPDGTLTEEERYLMSLGSEQQPAELPTMMPTVWPDAVMAQDLQAAPQAPDAFQMANQMQAPAPQQMPPQQPAQPLGNGLADQMRSVFTNLLFQAGVGMLNAPGNFGDWAGTLGAGGVAGANAVYQNQQAENELFELQTKRAEARRKRMKEDAKFEALEKVAQGYEAQGKPMLAALTRAEMGAQMPKTGLTPHYVKKDDGIYQRQFKSDGTFIDTKVDGTPFAIEKTTPDYLAAQEAAKVGARERTKEQLATEVATPAALQSAQETAQIAEQLFMHPGRTSATGVEQNIPWWPAGTERRNYETAFGQLSGKNFLAGVSQMTGMGALSDAEGKAIREAAAAIDLAQTDEEHERALAQIVANSRRAQQRIAGNAMLSPEDRVATGSATPEEVDEVLKELRRQRTGLIAKPAPTAEEGGTPVPPGRYRLKADGTMERIE